MMVCVDVCCLLICSEDTCVCCIRVQSDQDSNVYFNRSVKLRPQFETQLQIIHFLMAYFVALA